MVLGVPGATQNVQVNDNSAPVPLIQILLWVLLAQQAAAPPTVVGLLPPEIGEGQIAAILP